MITAIHVKATFYTVALLCSAIVNAGCDQPQGGSPTEPAADSRQQAPSTSPPAQSAKEDDSASTEISSKKCKKGTKVLGELCGRDNDCRSVECKKLTCVPRTRPFLEDGKQCKYDGDCCSGECKRFTCQPR